MRLQKAFGKTLRNLRTSAGLTQEALADKCGLDRTYISLLERGLRQPTLNTIFTLSQSVNIAPSVFVSLVEKDWGQDNDN